MDLDQLTYKGLMITTKLSICGNVSIEPNGCGVFSLTDAFQKTFNNLGALTKTILV